MSDDSPARRKILRLPDHDYYQGSYFVTICTLGKKCILGKVVGGEMQLSGNGRIVGEVFQWIPVQYPDVHINSYVVMPNHVQAILWLEPEDAGGSRTAPTRPKRKALGSVIGAFKTVSTKRMNMFNRTPAKIIWQRGYYERILISSKVIDATRDYIDRNPRQWQFDHENPEREE